MTSVDLPDLGAAVRCSRARRRACRRTASAPPAYGCVPGPDRKGRRRQSPPSESGCSAPPPGRFRRGEHPGEPSRPRCRKTRPMIFTASSSPARPGRAARTRRRWRRPWPGIFTPWRSGTAPGWRRTSGPGRGRTPSGACSSGNSGPNGRPPETRRSGRRSPRRCASAWRPWTTGYPGGIRGL